MGRITSSTPQAHEAVLSSSQLTVGLVGLGLWAFSLCSLGALAMTGLKPVHCASAITFLAFCGMVMFTATGYPFEEDATTPDKCRGLDCLPERRLRGEISL